MLIAITYFLYPQSKQKKIESNLDKIEEKTAEIQKEHTNVFENV